MNFRNISSWCIQNPVPPIVLFIGLMLAGLVAFMGMDVNNNPDIDFPAANVVISQPGAAPTEMENQITQKVEAAARSVNGVDEINSSVREGNSQTFVQFEIGTPTDRAVNDLRDAVAQIRSDLPDGILEPQISRIDFAGDPILFVAAETTDMTLEELSWYVDNNVSKRLLGVEGIAAVAREGGVDRQIRIILDPAALQAQGITAASVNQQLRQTNINATGGRAEIAGSEQSVRVLGNAKTAYDLSQTQIAVPGGRTVRLVDLGQVKDAYSEQRTIAKMNGRQVISFNVQRSKGASEVTAYDEAWAELRKIEKEDPRIRFVEIINQVDYTKEQYKSAMEGLIMGAVLAVLVVLLFLRDFRATVISALAIPLSAIPAFWFMSLMGITLNGLSLLAMSLVAGVLVDDAIVEIENIVRHMRMGKTAYQASMDAADEIGLAVVATTMSIVAVFLPVALMPGISGQFFKSFGYTVVISVLMSLFVARMITPLIAAFFLKAHGVQPHAAGTTMARYLGLLTWSLDTSKAEAYRREHPGFWRGVWSLVRDHRFAMVGVGLVAFIIQGVLFATLSMSFQPPLNLDFSRVRIGMPPGTTLEQTAAVSDQTAAIIEKNPAVDRVFQRIFVGSGFLNIVLKKDRAITSTEFERSLSPQLAAIPDAQVNFLSQGGGGPGSGGRDMVLYLGSDNPELLMNTANKIVDEMATLKELRAPRAVGDLVRPEITIKPRFDLAADLGVTTAALSQTIRIATLGDIAQNSAKFSLADRQVPITVSLPESARKDISVLENLPVPTSSGGSVPLKSIAEIGFGAGPTTVQRTNQIRRLAVGADLSPGLVSGDVWPKINELPTVKNLPDGVQKLELGDSKWQAELLYYFAIALASGVLLVFAVLVLLYRRFLSPFVNMGSLLLAPLGAAIGLHLTGNPVSLPVLIGILMLFGIVAKNSILLVDFAVEMMNHGMEKNEAIREAGHKRAQPIVMTTIAMVAGMVPIAISLTGDGSWRAPMGVTVIGGLIFSTALTLLLVPAFFSIAIDIERWIGAKFQRMVDNGEVHQPTDGPIPARRSDIGERFPKVAAMTSPPPSIAIRRFNAAQPGAAGMKAAATGLLVVMAVVFLVARYYEAAYPELAWVKAFAEAGMVGGLADWFAVTALFRHPLGLPIPHTAIIPRNKDRIGAALANFLKENFLIAPVVARRMRHIDLAGAAGRFLQAPRGEETRIRRGASRLIADLFESLDDERLGGLVKNSIANRIRAMEISPLLGHALASAINEDRHVPMLEAAIRWTARALDANEGLIRDMVHKRANWALKLAGLDAKLADAIVNGLKKLSTDMQEDPAHPMRVKIEQALADLANDLQLKPETRERVEAMKVDLLDNKSVSIWLDTLWQKGREAIIRAARNPDAAMAGKLGEVLQSMGQSLEKDDRMKRAINQFARRAVAGMAASYGSSIVKLVSETVRGWDAQTITNRLEAAVGRDLQYIRINGTLVGGLVGLILHALDGI